MMQHNSLSVPAPTEFQRRFHEKPTAEPIKGLDRFAKGLMGRWARRSGVRRQWEQKVQAALALADELRKVSDAALDSQIKKRIELAKLRGPMCLTPVVEDLAWVCELSRRKLGLTPYSVQMEAALALCQGYLTEIDTGEGKTLSLAIAASLSTLGGGRCHLITANDYLAERDAQTMAPLYESLGLSVGFVVGATEPQARLEAYRNPVVYTTAKEVAADYLRDRLVLGEFDCSGRRYTARRLAGLRENSGAMVQRGLFRAFVDEADNGLIDEATTPLIISQQQKVEHLEAACRAAWFVAQQLVEGVDYRVWRSERRLEYLPRGRDSARELGDYPESPLWACPTRRSQLVSLGLEAREFFKQGSHYIIEKKYIGTATSPIVIVDESTGRPMPNRSWKLGMHQMVEAKEGLPMTPPTQTIAQISFQTFFRKYGQLAGATGTAREIATEVWQTYDLATIRIPRNKPKQVSHGGVHFFITAEAKEAAVLDAIRSSQSTGQPVLVGTQSVTTSERMASRLQWSGILCEVLNATRLEEEAKIVAMAGQRGNVTISTNMAGRGTDIKLGSGVEALGGLHVIATEPHSSRRVERQLFGRAARQGAKGAISAYYSWEDDLFTRYLPQGLLKLCLFVNKSRLLGPLTGVFNSAVLSLVQRRAERMNKAARKQVADNEYRQRSELGFSR